jgi:tetratricopeptide (TPR) repeat protein
LHEAADALLADKEPALAGEAEALAAEAAWYRGERDELTVHLDHALELVEPLPASRSKAWILSQASRYAMLAGSGSQAIEYAGRALEMATALDLPDVRVHALNNRGSARAHGGDPGGIEDLEASATLAAELNSPEVARALNNLASIVYLLFGDLRQCLDLERRSLAAGERFGLETMVQFERANILSSLYPLGMWDEVHERIEALLADAPAAGPVAAARAMRARLRVARGDIPGGHDDSIYSLAAARRAADPQALFPALGTRAHVLVSAGELADGRALLKEFLALWEEWEERIPFVMGGETVSTWLAAGAREDLQRLFSLCKPGETLWLDAATAFVDENFDRAVEVYAQFESATDVAIVHLNAAEHFVAEGRRAEADVHLQPALAFYRSVGATFYIRQAEALLAATG